MTRLKCGCESKAEHAEHENMHASVPMWHADAVPRLDVVLGNKPRVPSDYDPLDPLLR